MNRALLIIMLACATFCARAQDALFAFTNRADQLLRPKWGFGVNEIPIYCSTNPLTRYNGGIHWLLQQAVNAYDQTNHTDGDFDFPSVFRPQFAVVTNDQCVTTLITNWVEAATDYTNIMARPFKTATDLSISADDNVWGVGLLIGFKPKVPIFYEFGCANNFTIFRKLQFTRRQPATRPYATNQMYVLSLSNVFGCSALNTWTQALPRDVTIYSTNSAAISLLNELGHGVTNSFTNGVAQLVFSNQWPKYTYRSTNMYQAFTNGVTTLPRAAYIEGNGLFGPYDDTDFESKVGLPAHSWFVNVTNRVVYALVDNSSGRILDFVNYDKFGTSRDMMQTLASMTNSIPSPWQTNGADSWSGPSLGVLNQIAIVTSNIVAPDYLPQPGANAAFRSFLDGTDTSTRLQMDCPYEPSATVQQVSTWWVSTPPPSNFGVISASDHFTIDEMAATTSLNTWRPIQPVWLFNPISASGALSPIQITHFASDSVNLALEFNAYTDGQYGVWSSPDLKNWSFVGVANESSTGVYTLTNAVDTKSPAAYFQARKL